jgi:hypothetical protein
VAAVTVSGLMAQVPFDRRLIPLTVDNLFLVSVANLLPGIFINFQSVLNASGIGQAKVAIPNVAGLVGVKIDACFATYDSGGVRAISNPWGFSITK